MADDLQCSVLILHPGKLHNNCVALATDLGLCDTESVDTTADNADRALELVTVHFGGRLKDDRGAALEVKAEKRTPTEHEGGEHPKDGDQYDDYE